MKKIYYLLILLIFIPFNVKAYFDVIDSRCTNSIKLSLKEEAENIKYRLSKNANGNDVTYNLIFYGLSDNFIINDNNNNVYKENAFNNLKPGTKLTLNFYVSNKSYCEGYRAGSRIINVPFYNKYYNTDICNGYEDYYLCNENSNIKLSEEEFHKKMSQYINNIKKEKEEPIIEVEEEQKFDFMEFFSTYGIDFIGAVAIVLVILIASKIEKRRNNKDIL